MLRQMLMGNGQMNQPSPQMVGPQMPQMPQMQKPMGQMDRFGQQQGSLMQMLYRGYR